MNNLSEFLNLMLYNKAQLETLFLNIDKYK